jgi:hypothetical protein
MGRTRPQVKVLRKEKFAREIFCYFAPVLCCSAKEIHGFVRPAAKPKADQQLQNGRSILR